MNQEVIVWPLGPSVLQPWVKPPLGRYHVKNTWGRPRATKEGSQIQVITWYVTDPRGPVICMCTLADVSRTRSQSSEFAVSELVVLLAFHQRTVLDLGRNNSSLIELSILTPSPVLSFLFIKVLTSKVLTLC